MYIVIESSIWLNKMVVSKICRFWMKFDWSNQTLLVTYKANLLILIFQQTRLTTFNEKNIIHKNITDDDDRSGDPALEIVSCYWWCYCWPDQYLCSGPCCGRSECTDTDHTTLEKPGSQVSALAPLDHCLSTWALERWWPGTVSAPSSGHLSW